MNYIGMDIHKQFTVAVAKDEQGNVLAEDKFENNKETFGEFLSKFPQEQTKIVMESTCVWQYIFDLLEEKGYEVKLSNPIKTKAIACARIKTDSVDASTLADLLRANLVAKSYIPNKEIRNLRDIVRQRKTLVKGRAAIKNKIHACLNMHGIKLPFATLCAKAIDWVIDEMKETTVKTIVLSYINLVEQYNGELKNIEYRIDQLACQDKQAKLLMTIPGIGSIRAMEILSEIADISRFGDSSKLCSYAGLVPSIRQSGESLRFRGLIQQASRSLKYVLVEASWTIIRVKESNQLQDFYKKICKKRGKQKAICATARKLCCIIHAMLRKQEEFKDFIIL
jgi:transposase